MSQTEDDSDVSPKPLRMWSQLDVKLWLKNHNLNYFISFFEQNSINDSCLGVLDMSILQMKLIQYYPQMQIGFMQQLIQETVKLCQC